METKDRTVTVAIITGIVTLLLGCCLGALLGGLGGYAIGRQAAPEVSERVMPEVPRMPVPVTPLVPETPALPRLQVPDVSGVSGAMVQEVVGGSPAEKAGLKTGDVITEVDGAPVDENHRLVDVLGEYKPGDQVTLKVWRMAEGTMVLKATLGENTDNAGKPYLGVRYVDLSIPRTTPTPGD